ncbi:MAG: MAPEG family protein [Pseudomonadota bacterium]
MTITLLYAGVLALFAVFLANLVLYVRLRPRAQPAWRAEAVERVQGNFVENVPLALILLALLEHGGLSGTALHLCGTTLLMLRALHAWGLGRYEGANYPRLIGAQGTFLLLSIMGIMAIALSLGSVH